MLTKKDFVRIMHTQSKIALATSTNNLPNVRIVNFYFEEQTNTMFFATFRNNDKVKEFEINSNIAFTTIPDQGNEHVKARGTVQKSKRTIFDVAAGFTNKIPDYKETIEQAGESLVLFEIKFITATVTLDFENIANITLK